MTCRHPATALRRMALLLVGMVPACGGDAPNDPTLTGPATPVATTVVVSTAAAVLDVGASAQLTAVVRDQNDAVMAGEVVTWVSDTPAVVTVDATGLATGVGPGAANVSATVASVSGQVTLGVGIVPLLASTVATGSAHSCALDASGQAYCWGEWASALGNGGVPSATPVPVSGGHAFEQISAGDGSHTCGLTVAGEVLCWGVNNWGQTDPSAVGTTMLVPVALPVTGTIVQVVAGGEFSCALDDSGAATCWGRNNEAQMGRGTTSATEGFGLVAGDIDFIQLGIGRAHGCGVSRLGEAHCWGRNVDQQIGDGTSSMALSPATVATAERFLQVSAGDKSSCGVSLVGEALCWGSDQNGLLGNGPDAATGTPTTVSGIAAVKQLEVGYAHVCAVTSGGGAHCWGSNDSGRLGTGDVGLGQSDVPLAVAGGLTLDEVTAGGTNSCGIDSSGGVHCWGANLSGQLGVGGAASQTVPLAVVGGISWDAVEAGRRFSCGIASGDAYCWGEGYTANEGPNLLGGGLTFAAISVGYEHACAIDDVGRAHCWGDNYFGQLGDGSYTDRSEPASVLSDSAFIDIAAGVGHTCATTASGVSYCWGDLNWSLFGDDGVAGTGGSVNSPRQGAVGVTLTAITVSRYFGCGVDIGDAAHCWGTGGDAMGSGTSTNSLPLPVSGGHSFAVVSAGERHTCGIDTAGDGWCWGTGYNGRLGQGSTASAASPVAISGGLSFLAISAGRNQTCSVIDSGAVYCWGHGGFGELGNGTTDIELTPVPATLDPTAVAVSVSTARSGDNQSNVCALMADGRAMCWGWNDYGQTGQVVLPSSAVPVATAPFP